MAENEHEINNDVDTDENPINIEDNIMFILDTLSKEHNKTTSFFNKKKSKNSNNNDSEESQDSDENNTDNDIDDKKSNIDYDSSNTKKKRLFNIFNKRKSKNYNKDKKKGKIPSYKDLLAKKNEQNLEHRETLIKRLFRLFFFQLIVMNIIIVAISCWIIFDFSIFKSLDNELMI